MCEILGREVIGEDDGAVSRNVDADHHQAAIDVGADRELNLIADSIARPVGVEANLDRRVRRDVRPRRIELDRDVRSEWWRDVAEAAEQQPPVLDLRARHSAIGETWQQPHDDVRRITELALQNGAIDAEFGGDLR